MEIFDNSFITLADDLIKRNLSRVKGKKVLVLGFSSQEVEKATKRNDIKKIGKFFYKKKFDSSRFFEFAKKQKHEFDFVFDLGFSSHFYKGELPAFYTYTSRLLGFKGKLYSVIPSKDSGSCRRRCPARLWSYFEGQYTRFVTEKELRHLMQANFGIEKIKVHSNGENSFFEVNAVNDMKKIGFK